MSFEQNLALCRKHTGRAVEIRMRNGRIHRGIIRRVDNRNVYLQPLGQNRNLGGYGFGFGGNYGYGGYGGFAAGFAIGAITSLVLLPFFFW
ncbi:hypothetical protein [Oceanobacillus chungangensis]|uniref:LSM domain-containing protein n=1 Tax=Oceanobacillus chungangensis TaxID=1229152 RepID=A0A3D8PRZ7_9BACI|nr:hypothetical protein [Oceanobacillus chungangensis]RDW18028.1 hypothetical protein CWR45_11930 [Oceanobacillus chungangensis]